MCIAQRRRTRGKPRVRVGEVRLQEGVERKYRQGIGEASKEGGRGEDDGVGEIDAAIFSAEGYLKESSSGDVGV